MSSLENFGKETGKPQLLCMSAGLTLMAAVVENTTIYTILSNGVYFAKGNHNEDKPYLLHVFTEHTDEITALCFSPDTRYLISGSKNGELFAWELDSTTDKEVQEKSGKNSLFPNPIVIEKYISGVFQILYTSSDLIMVTFINGHVKYYNSKTFRDINEKQN